MAGARRCLGSAIRAYLSVDFRIAKIVYFQIYGKH